jgi:CO/xanthine dehydrogenase FAD-binding subunit
VETSRQAWFQSLPHDILDIARIAELRAISVAQGITRLGALATWSDLAAHPFPPAFDALRDAARQVGGVQIQNRGTLGGNICNASPAADGVPPLLALDAQVELARPGGIRRLPLRDFILGNRRTALAHDEILTAILVPPPPLGERAVFLKLGARRYLVISIVSVAANIALDSSGRIASARISVGACSPVPVRLARLEAALCGQHPHEATVELTEADGLSPLGDVRASAAYRLNAATTLVRRAVAAFAPAASKAA